MSLNPNLSLKLQLGAELRKVSKLPQSLSELNFLISSLFGRQNFAVKYKDDEGDMISVTTDDELLSLYGLSAGKPSLKLLLIENSETSVLDRIESLRNSLLQSVIGDSLSQPDMVEEINQNSLNSIESINEAPSNVEAHIFTEKIETNENIETIEKIETVENFETTPEILEIVEEEKTLNVEKTKKSIKNTKKRKNRKKRKKTLLSL